MREHQRVWPAERVRDQHERAALASSRQRALHVFDLSRSVERAIIGIGPHNPGATDRAGAREAGDRRVDLAKRCRAAGIEPVDEDNRWRPRAPTVNLHAAPADINEPARCGMRGPSLMPAPAFKSGAGCDRGEQDRPYREKNESGLSIA